MAVPVAVLVREGHGELDGVVEGLENGEGQTDEVTEPEGDAVVVDVDVEVLQRIVLFDYR